MLPFDNTTFLTAASRTVMQMLDPETRPLNTPLPTATAVGHLFEYGELLQRGALDPDTMRGATNTTALTASHWQQLFSRCGPEFAHLRLRALSAGLSLRQQRIIKAAYNDGKRRWEAAERLREQQAAKEKAERLREQQAAVAAKNAVRNRKKREARKRKAAAAKAGAGEVLG